MVWLDLGLNPDLPEYWRTVYPLGYPYRRTVGVLFNPLGICPKVNVITRLEFELAYYDSAVHRFNHYTTRTSDNNNTGTWLRKGNFKRETESLPIAAQGNAIRTNHIKARIDKTQQNGKCRLCGDRDETINHTISECSKWAQKEYKARHDWVGKVIHCEKCRKFQFDHTNKWYMHNPAPVLENDSHKLLWDISIQTDHLIPARRPHLIIITKKKKRKKKEKRISKIVNFAVPADHRINLKECE